MAFEVGDGRRVKFWEDSWCGERTLKTEFPDIYDLAVNPTALVQQIYHFMVGI